MDPGFLVYAHTPTSGWVPSFAGVTDSAKMYSVIPDSIRNPVIHVNSNLRPLIITFQLLIGLFLAHLEHADYNLSTCEQSI